ncbi:uncharacterized protein MONBRDRAFT_8424 [Monosiga brevicollis MX1]|uniref:SEC7 domain-containing protein n=1 Tax=Monosiga brevicollis TaxID=81824 RepID=A9V004_MONBE|nr:uncharacterized protein MONBRDRAFT_8424 [Monosiga brevicollis MX1]EDQ89072.1 predicted protein [Monosiga brevicollis MX1]|eukprot:XP_001746177.1 hypothetical protein [Monosiga brevicollis MX1]
MSFSSGHVAVAPGAVPIHIGWMTKMGKHRASWKHRFFVLFQNGQVAYFPDENYQATKPKGTFSISARSQVLLESQCPVGIWPEEKTRPQTGFGLKTDSRLYYMYCEQPEAADRWRNALHQAIVKGLAATKTPLESSDEEDFEKTDPEALEAKSRDELLALSRCLQLRSSELSHSLARLESELQHMEDSAFLQREYIASLERLLTAHNIPYEDAVPRFGFAEEVFGFEEEDAAAAAAHPAVHPDSSTSADRVDPAVEYDARVRDRAAMVIQRAWHSHRLRKHFEQVRQQQLQRARARSVSSRRGTITANTRGLSVSRTRASLARQNRVPSTSLGLRSASNAYCGPSGGTLRHTSQNQRLMPSVNSLITLPKPGSSQTPNQRFNPTLVRIDTVREGRHSPLLRAHTVTERPGEDEEDEEAAAPPALTPTAPEADATAQHHLPAQPESPRTASPVAASDDLVDTENDAPRSRGDTLTEASVKANAPSTKPDSASGASRSPPASPLVLQRQSTASFALTSIPTAADPLRAARIAIYRFNRKPHKALDDLVAAGLVSNDPTSIVKFVCEEPGISRAAIGDLFGLPEERTRELLKAYAATFDFQNVTVDSALRLFLLSFRIPGEAQKIERVLMAFATRYYAQNEHSFNHEDTVLVLSFSILMLQTDLHNPSNPRRMTKEEFIRNNRGIDDGEDIPRGILEGIYKRIAEEEFQCCIDHTAITERYESRITNRLPERLVTEERAFVLETEVAELSRSKAKSNIKRQVSLVLFNDLLLVLLRSKWDRRFELKRYIPLAGVTVRKGPNTPAGRCYELAQDASGECVLRFGGLQDNYVLEQLRVYIRQTKDALDPNVRLSGTPPSTEC